jgi:anti-sigma factor RsiW
MFCDEALDAIEAIAAGDLRPDGRIAEHLASCANCAAALADARELEQLLRSRPVPRASAQFTARTMARVRRARWRSDQVFDAGFNLAIAVIVVGVVAAAWMFLRFSGLTAVSGDVVSLLGAAGTEVVRRVTPSLPLYAGAGALVAAALGFWWWAERGAS